MDMRTRVYVPVSVCVSNVNRVFFTCVHVSVINLFHDSQSVQSGFRKLLPSFFFHFNQIKSYLFARGRYSHIVPRFARIYLHR